MRCLPDSGFIAVQVRGTRCLPDSVFRVFVVELYRVIGMICLPNTRFSAFIVGGMRFLRNSTLDIRYIGIRGAGVDGIL